MAHAEQCIICKGKGAIVDATKSAQQSDGRVACHGCGGKGWVQIDDNEQDFPAPAYPFYPIPYSPPTAPWPQPYYTYWTTCGGAIGGGGTGNSC